MDDKYLDGLVPLGLMNAGREDVRELIALGSVVRQASMLDHLTRMTYVALVGSQYASVTAGGQMSWWLYDQCEAVVKHRTDVPDEERDALLDLLKRAREATAKRNRLVHDLWAYGEEGSVLLRSRTKTHRLTQQPMTVEGIADLYREMGHVTVSLMSWVGRVLGEEAESLEAQLRYEESQGDD